MESSNKMNEPAIEFQAINLEAIGVGDGFDTEMDEIEFDRFVHSTNDEITILGAPFICHPLLPLM